MLGHYYEVFQTRCWDVGVGKGCVVMRKERREEHRERIEMGLEVERMDRSSCK